MEYKRNYANEFELELYAGQQKRMEAPMESYTLGSLVQRKNKYWMNTDFI